MFLPDAAAMNERKAEEERRKQAFRQIESWTLELMPPAIRDAAVISAQELICNDPSCSPIDTSVSIMFQSGMAGYVGLPMSAAEVSKEELVSKFPTKEVLEAWHRGEDADWPPPEDALPQLRFDVGTRVLCRIGPDAEKDWTPGTVTQLWYAEKDWPEGAFAPYKIQLDDGRQIFAPGDMDQVIRRMPESYAAAAPTSTE
mmetsp:Transcript_602/g.1247  ORF Transcript_602/g.1247 Transcript_602/m.1247 type:complete len:200 (-) Transcript_602:219-818(-)|eukprot:CAMPEP_0197277348 /NCGR_PEP_ID=MMETSP1432-20130617/16935_1 /TAXON_ID=44447 /ORGANISM="Pseudo-nitzschia delicatissima, Strain UNC1205" /LENGTH=199 /DNA_ID=CAMNT_0042743529 /DNA_START=348 /DNA_END=947 /DNA_ORIENTATION=+